jgi:hypothetical protein
LKETQRQPTVCGVSPERSDLHLLIEEIVSFYTERGYGGTDIGIPNPFPLKSGRMYKCNAAHGLSPVLEDPGNDGVEVACKFTVEGADMDEFKTGRCARFPRRCISRVTS